MYRSTWLINVVWFEHWTALLNNACYSYVGSSSSSSIDFFSLFFDRAILKWISRSKTTVEVNEEEDDQMSHLFVINRHYSYASQPWTAKTLSRRERKKNFSSYHFDHCCLFLFVDSDINRSVYLQGSSSIIDAEIIMFEKLNGISIVLINIEEYQ